MRAVVARIEYEAMVEIGHTIADGCLFGNCQSGKLRKKIRGKKINLELCAGLHHYIFMSLTHVANFSMQLV